LGFRSVSICCNIKFKKIFASFFVSYFCPSCYYRFFDIHFLLRNKKYNPNNNAEIQESDEDQQENDENQPVIQDELEFVNQQDEDLDQIAGNEGIQNQANIENNH
jgi:uncharacterized protein (DUF2225 family)